MDGEQQRSSAGVCTALKDKCMQSVNGSKAAMQFNIRVLAVCTEEYKCQMQFSICCLAVGIN